MYVVTVSFEIIPGQVDSFLPLIVKNARASRDLEPGCQQFDVCRRGDEVFLYEVYDDRAAFDAHLGTDHFRAFDAEVADMISSKSVTLFDEVHR